MIIKPIELEAELLAYSCVRSNNANTKFTNLKKKNISKSLDKCEFDSFDLSSFHFGAFYKGELHACTRMVSDTKGESIFVLNEKTKNIITSFSSAVNPENGLALQDYVTTEQSPILEDFFQSLRDQGKRFNEIGRLIRCVKEGEKYLMNYMICYAWAFCRFHNIDYCFFEAAKPHCAYYERFFNCKHILQEIEFRPIAGGGSCYLMQATMDDLPEKMDVIVTKIVHLFDASNKPCSVKLKELK